MLRLNSLLLLFIVINSKILIDSYQCKKNNLLIVNRKKSFDLMHSTGWPINSLPDFKKVDLNNGYLFTDMIVVALDKVMPF